MKSAGSLGYGKSNSCLQRRKIVDNLVLKKNFLGCVYPFWIIPYIDLAIFPINFLLIYFSQIESMQNLLSNSSLSFYFKDILEEW